MSSALDGGFGAVLAVAVGGACGAMARAVLARWLRAGVSGWPWPTLIANLSASAAAGWLSQSAHGVWRLLLLVGVCGALSTYSTFALEVLRLARGSTDGEARRPGLALAYLVVSVLGCLAAALIGGSVASGTLPVSAR